MNFDALKEMFRNNGIPKIDGGITCMGSFSEISKTSLAANANRLNSSWIRAEYVIVRDSTSNDKEDCLTKWRNQALREGQFLVLNVADNGIEGWELYDWHGNLQGDINYIMKLICKVSALTSDKYRPYITAIKSKPFLLLAGISGTGKSRIVREMARACWEEGTEEYKEHRPKNFEMVQVKPNWHDSSELIGYVSRVSGKPEFIAGDFLKFVAKAWENIEVPYFLCLDEMNLAPVEQYFAEYLSVIESRKFQDDGTVMTDAILKKVDEEWYFNLTAQLTSNEAIRQQFNTNGITIPQNLIVVGTVNMDETTFSFSRKVLDRAMTIEMNEVDLKGGLEKHHEQIGKLGKAELIGTAVEGVDIYEPNKDVCDKVIDYLQKINSQLEGTPFKVAYRTRNEFLLYVVNNLPYKQEGESDDFVIQRALDEITSMKVLSRIEGDETKVSRTFLNSLEEVIRTALPEILEKDSVSLKKLTEMKKRLESGYTSFWS